MSLTSVTFAKEREDRKIKKAKKLSAKCAKAEYASGIASLKGRGVKKEKKPSRSKLENMLDSEWSIYVRNRDKICQKCHGHSPIAPHHAFGRRHRTTRWDVVNGVGLCFPCHIHWAHRDPCSFSVWFERHIGKDQYSRLSEAHSMEAKYTTEELVGMLNWFKQENV